MTKRLYGRNELVEKVFKMQRLLQLFRLNRSILLVGEKSWEPYAAETFHLKREKLITADDGGICGVLSHPAASSLVSSGGS